MTLKHCFPKDLIFIQSRDDMSESAVEEYAQMMLDGIPFDPASALTDGESIWVWDGFHRGRAAEQAGISFVVDVEQGTKEEAEWLALSANQKHGLRRSNADKQRVVRKALLHPNGVGKSNSAIAHHCGVSDKTVARIRAELEATSEIPKSDTRTGADGRTINTANIGSNQIDYRPVWELQHSVVNWVEQSGANIEVRIDVLESIKAGTPAGSELLETLLTGDVLPGPRRKRDVIQAVSNALDGLRQRQQRAAEAQQPDPARVGGQRATPFDYARPPSGYAHPTDKLDCHNCGESATVRRYSDDSYLCGACGDEWPDLAAYQAEREYFEPADSSQPQEVGAGAPASMASEQPQHGVYAVMQAVRRFDADQGRATNTWTCGRCRTQQMPAPCYKIVEFSQPICVDCLITLHQFAGPKPLICPRCLAGRGYQTIVEGKPAGVGGLACTFEACDGEWDNLRELRLESDESPAARPRQTSPALQRQRMQLDAMDRFSAVVRRASASDLETIGDWLDTLEASLQAVPA